MTRVALWLAVLSALLAPALARAETVPGSLGAQDALLAAAPDGSPRVAFVAADGTVEVAGRSADGLWSAQTLAGLPGPRSLVVGLAVAPGGGTVALLEDPAGQWLALAQQAAPGWRVRTVARAPRHALLGFGGLALDAAGRPWIGYAYELPSHRTWLRLVHESATGALVGEAVTKQGFPQSDVLPSAAPVVLPSGEVRVVEAYDVGTIEWARTKSRRDWIGQYLYGQAIGTPAGVVRAAAVGGQVWSAWTELFPTFSESQLVLALHRNGEQTSVLHHHAFLAALALSPTGPELAGDDYVDLGGGQTAYAGVVVDAHGGGVELAGDLYGYAIDAAAGRQYLLLGPDGLGWYRSAAAPAVTVTLSAAAAGASFALSGSVAGASGGQVELWRETQAGPQLAATVPLAPDGTFGTTDLPPTRPLTYRAVYRDPTSGLPFASLWRTLLGT